MNDKMDIDADYDKKFDAHKKIMMMIDDDADCK